MKKIIIITILIVFLLILINKIISQKEIGKIEKEKVSMYECGFAEWPERKKKYYIKYYIIGIIFLIFDLEAMLLYPTTKILDIVEYKGYTIILIFIIFLIIGLVYEINIPIVGLKLPSKKQKNMS